jgi:DNA-binding MarR family transcriptional regulator
VSPCACGRLRRATRAVTQLYDDALAPCGMRITQFSLLRTVQRNGETAISQLAAAALLDRTALSRTLDPLLEHGWVSVTIGSDARTRRVRLTAAGEAALAAAEPHWRRAQAKVAERLSSARFETLIALLADLEALHPAPAPLHPRAS